jgi:hypothetical protein
MTIIDKKKFCSHKNNTKSKPKRQECSEQFFSNNVSSFDIKKQTKIEIFSHTKMLSNLYPHLSQ